MEPKLPCRLGVLQELLFVLHVVRCSICLSRLRSPLQPCEEVPGWKFVGHLIDLAVLMAETFAADGPLLIDVPPSAIGNELRQSVLLFRRNDLCDNLLRFV